MQCCLTAALLFSSSTSEYAEALGERRTTFPGGLVRKEILLVRDAWTTTSSEKQPLTYAAMTTSF